MSSPLKSTGSEHKWVFCREDWHSWLGYPNRSIALWPDWFATPDSTWPAGVVPVGFIVDSDAETGEIPDEVQAILNGGEAPILITGGTGCI